MSYYYKYNFVSPDPVFAIVKEELKSYFDTGAIDDLLFPTYLDKCLKKLGRSSYIITTTVLHIENYEARLPDNFFAVREAWLCSEIPLTSYQDANSFYTQAASSTTIQVSPLTIGGTPCNNTACQNPECDGTCMPELIQAVYKTNHTTPRAYRRNFLLKPGNISMDKNCNVEYNRELIPHASSLDSFDIHDNKFVTNFKQGVVHLLMYVTEYDNVGNQMIPDNYRIKEYIEAFIKFKVFETLFNQINDETFNQIERKLAMYKQMSDEAFIMAMIEIKKQDSWTKQRRVEKDLNRFNMYELPRSNYSRYGRRRNN
jgi:hypothetical protein